MRAKACPTFFNEISPAAGPSRQTTQTDRLSHRLAPRRAPRYPCGMFRSVCLIALSLCAMAPAADWPQWRGLNRDGKSADTGLLAQWPAGGPRLVWKAQGLGEGYSSLDRK